MTRSLMPHAVYVSILFALVGSSALLASRAEHRRDPRWVGVVAIMVVTVVFAYTVGSDESA